MDISKISFVTYPNVALGNKNNSKNNFYSKVNNRSADIVSFLGKKSTIADDVVSYAFKKIFQVKNNKLRTFLGTTTNGDNITIRETKLGKSADLYISYANKPQAYDVFHLEKSSDTPSVITSEAGTKLKTNKIKQLKTILDKLG